VLRQRKKAKRSSERGSEKEKGKNAKEGKYFENAENISQ
jgi:hypothetical protein